MPLFFYWEIWPRSHPTPGSTPGISLGFPDYGRAILAANIVGYSRLMEQDEAGTLAALSW